MRAVEPAQAWGVSAAASGGIRPAVKNGWLPAGPDGTWVINSIGVISNAGRPLLIAVLSSGQPSESSGIRQVQAAARPRSPRSPPRPESSVPGAGHKVGEAAPAVVLTRAGT